MFDFLVRMGLSLLGFLVAFIPTWLYLAIRALLSPEGFIQEMLLFGIGAWFMGLVQLILVFFFIGWLFFVWTEK